MRHCRDAFLLATVIASACAIPMPAQAQATSSRASALPTTGGMRAQLVAVRHAVISSELAAKISSIPMREGQSFRQGDTIVAYDCALPRARLERANQARDRRTRETEGGRTTQRTGFDQPG